LIGHWALGIRHFAPVSGGSRQRVGLVLLKPARRDGTVPVMATGEDALKRDYPDLRDDQILAIGVYGETVAAYRYTVLSEKVPDPADRRTFAAIADEEQSHKQRLQALLDKYHPDSAFYLSDQDKALVVAGPRLINVRDVDDYRQVLDLALDTEYRVASFYEVMSKRVQNPALRSVFEELAREGFCHHQRLSELTRKHAPPPAGP